jgi:anti-anti-sigma regulatory factor
MTAAGSLVTTLEQRRSGARLIRLTGILDENNQLAELTDKLGAGAALINLSGVERINSAGVRDWMAWLASLKAKGTKPVLIACSPAVVERLNRITDFAGHAVIKSFQLPYACETCHVDKRMLVHVIDMKAPYTAPAHACDACGTAMRLVVEAQQYFEFLYRHAQTSVAHAATDDPAQRDSRDSGDSFVELARGSRNTPPPDQVMTIAGTPERISSQTRLRAQSQPSLSAFQLPDVRYSEREIPREDPNRNDKRYIIAVLALLFAALAVFALLLLQ